MCNYLEREVLKKTRWETSGFKRLCIVGTKGELKPPFVNSSKVCCVSVPFNKDEWQSICPTKVDEYLIQLLTKALELAEGQVDLPVQQFIEGLELFRLEGYENQWQFKSKSFNNRSNRASLICRLTRQKFELILEISSKAEILDSIQIMETPPDELVFQHKFRDLIVDGTSVKVVNRFDEIVYEYEF